eukprot:14327896-Ditylum_brightwellii.AAC.1
MELSNGLSNLRNDNKLPIPNLIPLLDKVNQLLVVVALRFICSRLLGVQERESLEQVGDTNLVGIFDCGAKVEGEGGRTTIGGVEDDMVPKLFQGALTCEHWAHNKGSCGVVYGDNLVRSQDNTVAYRNSNVAVNPLDVYQKM